MSAQLKLTHLFSLSFDALSSYYNSYCQLYEPNIIIAHGSENVLVLILFKHRGLHAYTKHQFQ